MRRFTEEELRKARNDIPVRWVIETLLHLPTKEVEGVYRFLCPTCNEFQTGLNPNTNLARCFRCKKNMNPIELMMVGRGLSFVQSVSLLLGKASAQPVGYQHKQVVSKEGCLKPLEIPSLRSLRLNISYDDD